jgi:hypothetical protein
VITLLIIFAVHKYLSAKEYNMLKDAGYVNSVSVGNYNLNVSIYGNEEESHTIVGISGMGCNDFAVTVKPFMERFTDKNKIVVIDRAGYGMSDDTKIPQTVEQIVSDVKLWLSPTSTDYPEYMKAFDEHSASTFAQNSESECSAENMRKTSEILKSNDIPKLYIDAACYTKEDMVSYYGFLYNSGMTHFVEDINPENTSEMDRLWEINGKANEEVYERFIKSYIEKLGNCQYVNIPGDHYIYAYKTDEVEEAVRSFIEGLE